MDRQLMWSKPLYAKSTFLIAISCLLISWVASGWDDNNLIPHSTDICNIQNTTFQNAEEIRYKAYYNWKFIWIPAGEALFRVTEHSNYYIIYVRANSYPSYNSFYKVNDRFQTKVRTTNLQPEHFVRDTDHNGNKAYDSISFVEKKGMGVSYSGKSKKQVKRKEIQINDCTYDLISVLYVLRNLNVKSYKAGDHVNANILFEDQLYHINVYYKGLEKNKNIREVGNFNTIRVDSDVITGNVFNEGTQMKIWVSADDAKVPLLVESDLAVGSAKAIMISTKNLRYPMSSKLE